MNTELKKIVSRVKSMQAQVQAVLKDKTWIEEARRYAQKQSREARKLLKTDISKFQSFIKKERKDLEKFQKQIPTEVAKVRRFVAGQRKELGKILAKVGPMKKKTAAAKKTVVKSSGATKRTTKKSAGLSTAASSAN